MFIKVRVIAGANRDKIVLKTKDSFDIHVKVKPIQGLANLAIISLLSKHFQIPEKNIKLVKGFKTKNKIFKIKA